MEGKEGKEDRGGWEREGEGDMEVGGEAGKGVGGVEEEGEAMQRIAQTTRGHSPEL